MGGYAQSFSDMGRYPDAVAQFQKALTLAPQKAEYWNGLCWSRAGAGKGLKEALVACNKALRLEPRAAAAFNSRGLVHLRMRRFPEAIADYNRALQLSPDQPSARFGLGLAKLSMGNTAGALNISQARLSDPDIDRQFVDMGVLPEHCIGVGSKRCPRGFPSAQALRTNPVTARLREPMRQEIMRMASLFPR